MKKYMQLRVVEREWIKSRVEDMVHWRYEMMTFEGAMWDEVVDSQYNQFEKSRDSALQGIMDMMGMNMDEMMDFRQTAYELIRDNGECGMVVDYLIKTLAIGL